jgi:hypothetical protein
MMVIRMVVVVMTRIERIHVCLYSLSIYSQGETNLFWKPKYGDTVVGYEAQGITTS